MIIRTIVIDIDTTMGNRLYRFLKAIMEKYPDEIKEKTQ